MIYYSPAKLNLFFRVLRKRSDGYHDIASLFQTIDLSDELHFFSSQEDLLTCSDSTLACDETNLVSKARAAYRLRFGGKPCHIHLIKNVPIQSGLGGGSSNAATMLWALNAMNGSPATVQELIEIGASIGSDVPFFLSEGCAYCTGRGEILEPVASAPISGWLVKPPYGLSTPAVYKATQVAELLPRDPEEVLRSFVGGEPLLFNDLELAALRLEPRLVALQIELRSQGFERFAMTGSGSAFFVLHEQRPKLSADHLVVAFHSMKRRAREWYSIG